MNGGAKRSINRNHAGHIRLSMVYFCIGKEAGMMGGSLTVISYTFAAMAGICFIKGLALLSDRRG